MDFSFPPGAYFFLKKSKQKNRKEMNSWPRHTRQASSTKRLPHMANSLSCKRCRALPFRSADPTLTATISLQAMRLRPFGWCMIIIISKSHVSLRLTPKFCHWVLQGCAKFHSASFTRLFISKKKHVVFYMLFLIYIKIFISLNSSRLFRKVFHLHKFRPYILLLWRLRQFYIQQKSRLLYC